jgi:amidase
LHGVPFSIKDNLDQLGKPNTNGIEENLNLIAQRDALVVERMRAAGGVPLGRTNLPDMALRVHTYSEAWGRTLNPWSPKHNVAGSSGGEAAAIATGMSPIGLGNDIGGSLRNPATCCAIASLKPSLGRVPQFPQGAGGGIGSQLMAVSGPMARTVGDVRLGYEILAGQHPGDAWSAPVDLDLPSPSSKKVALMPEPSGGETHPSVAEAVRQAGRALTEAGYEVEEVEPPSFVDVVNTWVDLILVELEGARPFFRQVMNPEASRFLDLIYENWTGRGMQTLTSALQRRHGLGSEWSRFFVEYPMVVGPIFTQPPFEVGYDIAGKAEAWDTLVQLRLTVAANILSLPAAAVPTGIGADGLPRGVQVIGARFRDDLCLEGAQAIEDALGTFTPIDPRA